MTEFVGDPIKPDKGGFDVAAMSRGEPGLPSGFVWRGDGFQVKSRRKAWKFSERERGHAGGELYLRRHYYELTMSDDSVWTVYFIRQPTKSGSPKARWFLYTIDR